MGHLSVITLKLPLNELQCKEETVEVLLLTFLRSKSQYQLQLYTAKIKNNLHGVFSVVQQNMNVFCVKTPNDKHCVVKVFHGSLWKKLTTAQISDLWKVIPDS